MTTLALTHPVASKMDWLEARIALLAKEKEFTRQRDALSRQRRVAAASVAQICFRFQVAARRSD